MTIWRITYRNQGKPEKCPLFEATREEAERRADFLKFQGATSVRLHETATDPTTFKASGYFGRHSSRSPLADSQ